MSRQPQQRSSRRTEAAGSGGGGVGGYNDDIRTSLESYGESDMGSFSVSGWGGVSGDRSQPLTVDSQRGNPQQYPRQQHQQQQQQHQWQQHQNQQNQQHPNQHQHQQNQQHQIQQHQHQHPRRHVRHRSGGSTSVGSSSSAGGSSRGSMRRDAQGGRGRDATSNNPEPRALATAPSSASSTLSPTNTVPAQGGRSTTAATTYRARAASASTNSSGGGMGNGAVPPPPSPSTASVASAASSRAASSVPPTAPVAAMVTTVTAHHRSVVQAPQGQGVGVAAGAQQVTHAISVESPLPPVVQRCLGDRSYDKRKNAALEIEALVKNLQETGSSPMIRSVVAVLSKDFCTSMNANYRKGGLIGIAATAIGLMGNTRRYLDAMLPPVLHCFDDPESRVRYYACESLYNIAKVARTSILRYFNQIFDGLTKLFADVDVDVKNGANLLDRLIKDIVTESDNFDVEQFLPLLQNYIRRTNPYIRQLLVGWISVLDSIPDISMIDYLPDFLDGLFNMLSDSNREIRQAADSALSEFLREVRGSTVVEFGPMVSILVLQCHSKERLNRLTAITWLAELIHHPYSGGDALLAYHAEVLGAIVRCISDGEAEIRRVSEATDADLLVLVRDTAGHFELSPLLDTLTTELVGKDDVPTKMAALRWINMLLNKRKGDMGEFIPNLLPVLLRTLSDTSDLVVILTCQVLSRISLSDGDQSDGKQEINKKDGKVGKKLFQMVLNAILGLFASDRVLLEMRGSLIVRKLCVLLNAKSVYIQMAEALSKHDPTITAGKGTSKGTAQRYSLEFISTMVQTLNLILLTASELHSLRTILAQSVIPREDFVEEEDKFSEQRISFEGDGDGRDDNGAKVFASLFHCWCFNPVATFSLCLLARAYHVAFQLVKKFSSLDVTVGFLMQMDKLVQLLESPIFVHLRLQLLDVESPSHVHLLKSCYGVLMLLPQSDAFRTLNDRLTAVCNLRDNLNVSPRIMTTDVATTTMGLETDKLLRRFDEVTEMHRGATRGMKDQDPGVESGLAKGAGTTFAMGQHVSSAGQRASYGGGLVGGAPVTPQKKPGELPPSTVPMTHGPNTSEGSVVGGGGMYIPASSNDGPSARAATIGLPVRGAAMTIQGPNNAAVGDRPIRDGRE